MEPHGALRDRTPDVQASAPHVHVSLSRVGVTGVEKVIRIGKPARSSSTHAKLECFVDLGPQQKGAHMSRFEEVVNDAIGEVVLGERGFKAEQLAAAHRRARARAPGRAARRGDDRRPLPRAQARAGRRASRRRRSTRCYGSAVASETGTRRLVGVAAQGMTACPCAQQLVAGARARAARRRRLQRRRDRAHLRGRPRRHAQPARPRARCYIGCPEDCDTEIEARRRCSTSSRSSMSARSTS